MGWLGASCSLVVEEREREAGGRYFPKRKSGAVAEVEGRSTLQDHLDSSAFPMAAAVAAAEE